MPIEEKTLVDIREEMVVAALQQDATVTEVAAQFGISRPTVRLWRERYRQQGRAGLSERSHATEHCPHRTSEAVEELIVTERKRWGWGSKKLLRRLSEAHPEVEFPQRSTIDAILSRHGLVEGQKKKRRPPAVRPFAARYEPSEPAELMTIDFKGQFRLRAGRYCYPLTMVDSVSRFLLACEALRSTDFRHSWPVIERVFREHGLPAAMQSDNGPPFGAPHGRFSTMSVVLMALGVQPVFSRPGKPQDNGRHERMHRDLKADVVRHRGATLSEQQKFFDAFRHTYNVERPHEGIGQDRPARRFRSSPRPFPRRPPEPDYPAHWETRKVFGDGMVGWRSARVFLSNAFAGHVVAFEPIDCDLWQLHFHRFIIGRFDERSKRII
jgi:transposase InsO family protein